MKTGFIFLRTRNVLLLKEIPTLVEALIPPLHQIFYATRKRVFCLLLTPQLNGLLHIAVRLETSPCQSAFHRTEDMEGPGCMGDVQESPIQVAQRFPRYVELCVVVHCPAGG